MALWNACCEGASALGQSVCSSLRYSSTNLPASMSDSGREREREDVPVVEGAAGGREAGRDAPPAQQFKVRQLLVGAAGPRGRPAARAQPSGAFPFASRPPSP